jgi:hypothetical protein
VNVRRRWSYRITYELTAAEIIVLTIDPPYYQPSANDLRR